MKYTEHFILAALLLPTVTVLLAAGLSLFTPETGAPEQVPAPYAELEKQP